MSYADDHHEDEMYEDYLNKKSKLSDVFNDMIGKNVVFIDSTNYLLRTSGVLSVTKGVVTIKKKHDRVTILIKSITSFKRVESNNAKNLRFKMINGHNFDLVY